MHYWLAPRLAQYLSSLNLIQVSFSLANSCRFEKSGDKELEKETSAMESVRISPSTKYAMTAS
jgi:hypothetical protein